MEETRLDARALALEAARAADDKKAEDVMVLDVGDLLVVTDYFVICTASNRVLMQSVVEEVEKRLKARDASVIGREGRADGGWLLLDVGGVVVHVFDPETRGFYRLEKLWGDAPRVVWDEPRAAERGA